jgi:hypothetical protein
MITWIAYILPNKSPTPFPSKIKKETPYFLPPTNTTKTGKKSSMPLFLYALLAVAALLSK